MNVKNLAQGEFVIMGGYLAWHLSTLGIHPIASLPIVIAIMFAFGWALYVLIIKYVVSRELFTSLLHDHPFRFLSRELGLPWRCIPGMGKRRKSLGAAPAPVAAPGSISDW